jgi:sec-independent protein translocase protein TatA
MGSGLLTPGHLIILVVIALLVFGPKRLPELGRSLGSGMRGFKRAIEGDDDEPRTIADPPASAPAAADPSETEPGAAEKKSARVS